MRLYGCQCLLWWQRTKEAKEDDIALKKNTGRNTRPRWEPAVAYQFHPKFHIFSQLDLQGSCLLAFKLCHSLSRLVSTLFRLSESITPLGQPGEKTTNIPTNQPVEKSYISELAFDNSDYVAKLRVSEHLKVVGQLVSQACRTECTGRGNFDVSRKMTILEWYLPFAPAKIWPPTTSAISGTPRSLTYELLWESPNSLNRNLKSHRLVDVIPILNNVLPNTRTILR